MKKIVLVEPQYAVTFSHAALDYTTDEEISRKKRFDDIAIDFDWILKESQVSWVCTSLIY